MTVNPRALGRTPAQATGLALASLTGRVSALERRPANAKGYDFEAGQVAATGFAPPSYESLGGPSVQIRVPSPTGAAGSAYVQIILDLEVSGVGAGGLIELAVHEPTDNPTPGAAAPFYDFGPISPGVGWNRYMSPVIFKLATPGVRTYTLYYRRDGGTKQYRNRRMLIESS
jgi:hypothetical protein